MHRPRNYYPYYPYLKINDKAFYLNPKSKEAKIEESINIYLRHYNKRITSIHITGNIQFKQFPEFLYKFNNIEDLALRGLSLREIPEQFYIFKELRKLHLGHNQITEIPLSIIEFPHLQYLNLMSNYIESLPVLELIKIKNLELKVGNNPLCKETESKIRFLFPEAF